MELTELFEAKVSGTNVGIAMSKSIAYIEKKLGVKLVKLGVEHFRNSAGEGHGIRYVEDGTTNCIRFNWVGSKSSEIVSVDLWNGTSHDPQFNVSFKGISFVKALPTLVSVMRKPKLGVVKPIAEVALTEGANDLDEYKALLKSHDWNYDYSDDQDEYDRGYNEFRKLKRLAVKLDPSFKIWNSIAPPEGRRSTRKSEPEDGYDDYGLNEAKKGEYTPETAVADMISKLEAGRSFNRSEFIMNYHPENAHAYDEFIEKYRDQLIVQGKRISLPKGEKLGKPAAKKAASRGKAYSLKDGEVEKGEVHVERGGKGEEYEVDMPPSPDRVTFSESLEHLEGLTTGLIKGSFNALFVAGRGGTGKTQTVENTLEDHGLADGSGYFKITASASPIGIYTALYKNRTGIVMFDDCDGALETQDGRNIIKAATDTKKKRKVSWGKKSSGMYDPAEEIPKKKGSKAKDDEEENLETDDAEGGDEAASIDPDRLPNNFEFTGRVIFISNLPLNKLDPDGALRTRAFIISIDPTPEEIFERMGEIVNDIKIEGGSLTEKERQEVLKVVKTSRNAQSASLRTLVRALGLAASGAKNWRKLVELYA